MARIVAVCKSEEKGTRKQDAKEGLLEADHGLAGDAHADCCTHRQVSLLATDSIEKMRSLGFDVNPGDFAENLTTEGIDLVSLPIGRRGYSGGYPNWQGLPCRVRYIPPDRQVRYA